MIDNVLYANGEKSIALFNVSKYPAKAGQCYHNIYHLALEHMSRFVNDGWKVGFCYMQLDSNLYCRHCVIINELGEVLDPSCASQLTPSEIESKAYIVFGQLTYEEFFTLIVQNHSYPDLLPHFQQIESKLLKEAAKKGLILIR